MSRPVCFFQPKKTLVELLQTDWDWLLALARRWHNGCSNRPGWAGAACNGNTGWGERGPSQQRTTGSFHRPHRRGDHRQHTDQTQQLSPVTRTDLVIIVVWRLGWVEMFCTAVALHGKAAVATAATSSHRRKLTLLPTNCITARQPR